MGKIYDIETVKDSKAVNLNEAETKDGVITVPENVAELNIASGVTIEVTKDEK